MSRTLIVAISILFLFSMANADELLTIAEKSNFTATASSDDVLVFAKALASQSNMVHFTTIGKSAGRRDIPLLIIGKPAPTSAAEMINDPRQVIYIQANIHGGEVEGKEAVLMLARDIASGKITGLLDDLVILIVPNYNSDGNDHIDPQNRSYQGGPENGVGLRTNDLNMDLNRDWMKLESSEAQAVAGKILNLWDPVMLIDCHTTDGSLHLEPMTLSPQLHPSGDAALMDYAWNDMLPAAQKVLKDDFGYDSIFYGGFRSRDDGSRYWETFGHHPRYTTNYIGLRNRIGMLLETYAYADFKDRVMSSYGILVGLLKEAAKDKDQIAAMILAADRAASNRANGLDAEKDALAVAVELKARPDKVLIKTWESAERYTDENGKRGIRPVGERVDVEVEYFAQFEPTKFATLPTYYALPAHETRVIEKLRQHGIRVEKVLEATGLDAQQFQISEIVPAKSLYQGHQNLTISGEWKETFANIESGWYLVSTAQPLGMLAASLLDPESDDGLTVWNYFDREIIGSWGRGSKPHPVLKLWTSQPIVTAIIE
jgi:dipeptidyl-peptidase-4